MNFSTLLGFIGALAVFLHSVLTSTSNRGVFLNEHGIIIVMGGTLTAGAICFPLFRMFKLALMAFKKMLFGQQIDYRATIKQMVEMADKVRTDPNFLKKEVGVIRQPFLKESISLVNDGFPEDQIREILETRIATHKSRNNNETKIFQTMAKFPPAFGLLGTTLGMIALLQELGTEDAVKKIGPAMAIGLVATMYGITLSNFVFIPIAENLAEKNREDTTLRKIILEGVLMLKSRMHPLLIEEKLNSYLLPSERISLRGGGSGDSGRKAA